MIQVITKSLVSQAFSPANLEFLAVEGFQLMEGLLAFCEQAGILNRQSHLVSQDLKDRAVLFCKC